MESMIGFPQHYAAASLKLLGVCSTARMPGGFPQHYAAASLKLGVLVVMISVLLSFSAALRCGLIEAQLDLERVQGALDVFRSITLRPH